MRPTLRQLQYITAVADEGRFGDAARRLNVSQPSLSAQIAEAEAQLGALVFERGRSGVFLTPIGEDVVKRARLILREVEDLKTAAQSGGQALSGRLRLGVLPTIGPYLLPRVVKRLREEHPNLQMSVHDERTIDLDEKLHDGRVDTIISTPQNHTETKQIPLFSERLWACASPDDPIAGSSAPVTLKDLKGRALLTLGFGHRLNEMVQSLAEAAGGFVSGEYEGTSLDALRQTASMGTGIAVLPSLYTLSEAGRDPDLVLRRIDHPLAHREVSLIWRESSPLAESFTALAAILKGVAVQLLRDETELIRANR